MLRLILLRHAKTERTSPSGGDHDRRLEPRGYSDADEIGQWIAGHSTPERVLVSTATRARQTWDAISRMFPSAISENVAELYNAEPGDILHAIHTLGGKAARLMIVAHNPGLHELAFALIAGGDKAGLKALDENLPTSGVVTIDFDCPTWDDVGFRTGHLVSFVSPKSLREAPEAT